MTRLSVPSEDVLGENYKITNITASNYNPTIDSTITVTITVKDVYGDEIEDEYVTITCNVGKFTKLNGSTISDTQSVIAQTDNDGEISLTYTCSEWGLVTFSANTKNIQIIVKGWRYIQGTNSSSWALQRNETMGRLILRNYLVPIAASWADFGGGTAYASDFAPHYQTKFEGNQDNVQFMVKGDGSFEYKNTRSSSANVYMQGEWTIK